jgi:hypothetical protein
MLYRPLRCQNTLAYFATTISYARNNWAQALLSQNSESLIIFNHVKFDPILKYKDSS